MRTDTSVAVTFVDDVLPEVLNEGTVVQTGTVHYGQLAFPKVKAVSKVLVQLNVQTRVQVNLTGALLLAKQERTMMDTNADDDN